MLKKYRKKVNEPNLNLTRNQQETMRLPERVTMLSTSPINNHNKTKRFVKLMRLFCGMQYLIPYKDFSNNDEQ